MRTILSVLLSIPTLTLMGAYVIFLQPFIILDSLLYMKKTGFKLQYKTRINEMYPRIMLSKK